jgi:eukaryotic-like serine/threonine-protein kinase
VPHRPEGTKVESGTLPRGTLVRARLAAPVDPAKAAVVEAVVAENVMSAAGVLVPAGSTLVCSSRVSKDGRVPVSCDAIRTANRSWSFSGLAVGEGQHFGLRVVDTAVPAGSSFVVYVDAEFR